jgi:hypothetical protein
VENKFSAKKFLIVLVAGTILTTLFVFLGTPILRVLRGVFGSWRYWLSGLIVTGLLLSGGQGFLLIAFLLASLWITVGVYQEFEERGRGNLWMAGIAIITGSVFMILGPILISRFFGVDLTEVLKASLVEVGKQLSGGKGLEEMGLSADILVSRIPSTVILMQMTSLAFALMLDRRAALLMGVRFERVASEMRLLELRLPDIFIWITMLSFLFSFILAKETLGAVAAINVFAVMMGLYFFQGLAVMEVSFLVYKIGNFSKMLIYFLVVGQLFFLLSAVGVIDYWVDFRQRMRKRLLPQRNQNGENI